MSMKVLWRFAGILIAIASGGYFISYASSHVVDFPESIWDLENIFLLGVSVLLWCANIILGALIWQRILRDIGLKLEVAQCLEIYTLTQFGKYLPGNVAHHIGRVVLAKQAGITVRATTHSMLIEFLWGIGAASSMALLGLVYFNPGDNGISTITLVLLMIFTMLLPWLGVWLANTFFPGIAERLSGSGKIILPSLRTMLWCNLAFVGSFLIMGLILDLQAKFIFDVADSHLLMLVGAFALSWIAGYITPGAPAGLGVREAVLVSFLSPVLGGSTAVGLSLALRLATSLGDGVCFLFALAMHRLKPN